MIVNPERQLAERAFDFMKSLADLPVNRPITVNFNTLRRHYMRDNPDVLEECEVVIRIPYSAMRVRS